MEETDLEFEFYLADRLKMTVARLRREMPAQEFMQWNVYHGRRVQRIEMNQRQAKRGR